MTKMTYTYANREWTLTDEASASSYGIPVLVSDDGRQMATGEIAIEAGVDHEFGLEFGAVTAYDIVCQGSRNHGDEISREDWAEFKPMLDRFAASHRVGA